MTRLAVFAYNFPHRRTQDVLLRLFVDGYQVDTVFAADFTPLGIPPAAVRTKLRHGALVHPRDVAERIGARYHVLPHNSPECVEIVREHGLDLAVVAGARILKRPIIEAFQVGIINLHPGLIPDARGLDALLWSVYRDVPLGVTAHLIDHRVDAGRILIRQEIPILCDDTVLDLSERLYDQQLDMLSPAIERARRGEGTPLSDAGCYNRKMPAELEVEALARIPEYVARRRTCD